MDPDGTVNALNRAISLMAQLGEATIARNIIDEHPNKPVPLEIELNTRALNIRLGTDLDADQIQKILESVAFKVDRTADTTLNVGVPSFRVDVTRPEDLSEEVARLWGYNNIQTSYPLVPAQGKLLNPVILLREKIRQTMIGFSFFEALNYNFINAASCDRLNLSDTDERRQVETILNPISDQMSVLRSTMIPGLLETMKKNISQQTTSLKVFEIGKVFTAVQKGTQPRETEMVAGLMTGNRSDQSWYSKKCELDFFDLKGVVEGFFKSFLIKNINFEKIENDAHPYYKKGYAALVKSGDTQVGTLGKMDDKVLKNYGLKQDAFVFDFNVEALQAVLPESLIVALLPKFPSISRDITIIVDRTVAAGAILEQIQGAYQKEALIEKMFLFDAFEGQPLAEDKKSLSFRVVYRATGKTLKEKNIKKLHTNISRTILDKFHANLPD